VIWIKSPGRALMHHKRMDLMERDGGQPTCPLCAGAMPLVLKLQHASGRELRHFCCARCDVTFMEQGLPAAASTLQVHPEVPLSGSP
jgi:hypothetical protein